MTRPRAEAELADWTRCVRGWLSPLSFLAAAVMPACAAAAIYGLVWQPIEAVDQPVTEVPSPAGVSMVFDSGLWRVVYARAGEVCHRARADSGWLAVEPLTTAIGSARDPHLAVSFDGLRLVVWEDERQGHPEVWSRLHDGSTWGPEMCLTCDAAPSRAPVVVPTLEETGGFFVAWEEESLLVRQVRGRFFRNGAWLPVEMVSESVADAFEPTVATDGPFGPDVAWADTRHGPAELYVRSWDQFRGGWQPEERLTQYGIGGRPSIHSETCCGDLVHRRWMIGFEQDLGGVTECFVRHMDYDAAQLSSDDGVGSIRPSSTGYSVIGPWPAVYSPRFLVAWTDVPMPGPRWHMLASGETGETELISQDGLSLALVAAADGKPLARVLVLWTEARDGVPTLLSRRGTLPGNVGVEAAADAGVRFSAHPIPSRGAIAFMIPEGLLQASIRVVDSAGRLVRTLAADGARPLQWDLLDARGLRVAPGRYIAILESGGTRQWRPLVVLE